MKEDLRKRVEQTLNSLDGMQRAEANPYLYSKIKNRLQAEKAFIPTALAWRMVAALTIVTLVNVFTIRHFQSSETNHKNGAQLVANEYAIELPQTY